MNDLQEFYEKLRGKLSVRAINVLKRNKLFEYSAFLAKTSKPYFSFISLRNCGKKTAQELNLVLEKIRENQPTNIKDTSEIVNETHTQFVIGQKIKTPIDEYNLSARSINCLRKSEITTLGELVALDKDSILKIPALGKRSFQEIENLVVSEGFHWGMDISKYQFLSDKETQYQDPKLSYLSKVDKSFVMYFKVKNGYFPMLFLTYKSLDILKEYEKDIIKLSWGIKNFSFLPYHNTLEDLSKWSEETVLPISLYEIADLYKLTRERIRQILDNCNKKLIASKLVKQLFQYKDWNVYKNDLFQPFLFCDNISFEKIDAEKKFIVEYIKEHSTAKWINEFAAGLPCFSANLYCFIFRLNGMNPYWIDFDKKELNPRHKSKSSTMPYLFISSQLSKYNYGKAIKEIQRLQRIRKTENVVIPIVNYFIENETYWNGNYEIYEKDRENVLQLLIRLAHILCDVQIEDNCLLFKANKVDYCSLLFDILRAAGKRMHRDELFSRLKSICQEKGIGNFDFTEPAQIASFLSMDSRIVPIGKSSYWGLKEWGEIPGSIREIALKLMHKSKVPIQIENLAAEVLKHRPDSAMDNVMTIIRQSVYTGELLLFFDDYIGLPKRNYDEKYIIYPRSFQEWIDAFRFFVLKNKHYPYCRQNGYEGFLYRWHNKAVQLTELKPDEILKIDALEKELSHYPHNATENKFLHNCNLYKNFVEGNNRMLEESDDKELFKWFYSASRDYSSYNDNRTKYFSQLLQYLSNKLY